MKKLSIYSVIMYLLSNSLALANNTYHAHADIIATVQTYLDNHLHSSSNIEIKSQIGHLDKRLKLTKCDQELTAFTSNNANFGSKISVGIKCSGIKPWSLYVPVNIQRFASVYIAAQPLTKGDEITANDIQLVSRDVNKLHGGYHKNKKDIIGKIAKRSINIGSVFNPRYLRYPILIKKGDIVDIVAETNGLQIRMSGTAINDGALGQKISVKNRSSKRVIEAIVQHAGLVKITL